MTVEIRAARQELCAAPITLDGRPASLSGWATADAVVRGKDRWPPINFPWPAAERVIQQEGGRFVTRRRGGFSA